ncbi:hypothetical protein HY413_03625 [Candidatus Kaiserbacteria bacterium]|nr:hypothetical protein [Candidatus Kaiserbacteria bacterium]
MEPRFETSKIAKANRWFSRRHSNRDAHEEVRSVREHRRLKKVADADVRMAYAAARTPQEQLARLDAKLGKGIGAVKERAKLVARIAALKK